MSVDQGSMMFAAGSCDGGFQPGITYRQWIAGLAMQGLLANPNIASLVNEKIYEHVDAIEKAAVEYADSLIAELRRTEQ